MILHLDKWSYSYKTDMIDNIKFVPLVVLMYSSVLMTKVPIMSEMRDGCDKVLIEYMLTKIYMFLVSFPMYNR